VWDPLVAVGRSASLAVIRRALAGVARKLGLTDINAEVVRVAAPRRFTQEISRFIYEQAQPDGSPYGGIFCLSRNGDDVQDFAIFERDGEPFPFIHLERRDIAIDDTYFLEACRVLGIQPEYVQSSARHRGPALPRVGLHLSRAVGPLDIYLGRTKLCA